MISYVTPDMVQIWELGKFSPQEAYIPCTIKLIEDHNGNQESRTFKLKNDEVNVLIHGLGLKKIKIHEDQPSYNKTYDYVFLRDFEKNRDIDFNTTKFLTNIFN